MYNSLENRTILEEEDEKQIICPNCGSNDIITDETRGEKICSQCGLVIEDRMVDPGTEWRAYNKDEFEKRARSETSSYSLNNDLSTYIGFENTDALGHSIAPDKLSQLYRMRRWQLRIKSQDSKDWNLKKANQELERLCSQLDVPRSVKETAGKIYKKSFEAGVIRGYPIDSMVAASVYAAARVRRVPRTLEEIANATLITKKRVAQCYRIIINRMHYKIPLSRPTDFLVRLGTELDMSNSSQQFASKTIEEAIAKKLTIGKDPSGLAAAALYLASITHGEKRNQKELAHASHVTEVTIRHRFKDLITTLGPEYIKNNQIHQ